jgi:hypothetical protein
MTGEPANTLLYAPLGSSIDDEACVHLTSRTPLEGATVLCVTFTQTADDRLDALPRRDELAEIGLVTVGQSADSGSSADEASVRRLSVRSPDDLARLGLTISKYLRETAGDGPTVVCFHSLTGLLQFVDRDRAYRFLLTLKDKLADVDATAHYHIDPDAHGSDTEYALRPLFDAVVDAGDLLTGDGTAGPSSLPVESQGDAAAPLGTTDTLEPGAAPSAPDQREHAVDESDAVVWETDVSDAAVTDSPEDGDGASTSDEEDAAADPASEDDSVDESEFVWGPTIEESEFVWGTTVEESEFVWGPHPKLDADGSATDASASAGDGSAAAGEPGAGRLDDSGVPVEWATSESTGDEPTTEESRWVVEPVGSTARWSRLLAAGRVLRVVAGLALILGGAALATLEFSAEETLLRLTGVLASVIGAILISDTDEN